MKLFENPNLSPTILDVSQDFPAYVSQRLRKILIFLCTGAGLVGISSYIICRHSNIYNILDLKASLIPVLLVTSNNILLEYIPYPRNRKFGIKHVLWLIHCFGVSLLISPAIYEHQPKMTQILLRESCLVVFLSGITVIIPNDRYLQIGRLSSIGLLLLVSAIIREIIVYNFHL